MVHGSLSLTLGVVHFFISVIATLLFSIMPSGRIFGDLVRSESKVEGLRLTLLLPRFSEGGTLLVFGHLSELRLLTDPFPA